MYKISARGLYFHVVRAHNLSQISHGKIDVDYKIGHLIEKRKSANARFATRMTAFRDFALSNFLFSKTKPKRLKLIEHTTCNSLDSRLQTLESRENKLKYVTYYMCI